MIRWMAWRLHRRGLIGFAGGGFFFSFAYGAAFVSAAGGTAASQAAFGRAVELVAKQFAFIIPMPVHPETLGGYEQYKWLSGAVILMMVWAAVAGVGVGRGEEETGLTEQWLASGLSRSRLLLYRSAAFALVLGAACLGSTLGISAVAPLVHQDPNLAGEVGKAVSMAFGLYAGYAIALFVSQLPAERQTATALGVGALVLLLIVNGVADTVPSAASIGAISPFHWMELTSSAAPGGTFDWGATALLAAVGAVFLAAAVAAANRRDLRRGLIDLGRRAPRAVHQASTNAMLRTPFSEGLWEQRAGLAAWAVGTFLLGALMVSVTKSIGNAIFSDPELAALFRRAMGGSGYAQLLGLVWFGIALLLLAGYSVVQVSRWATMDGDGRVDMLLSAPVSRSRIVVDRALEFALASLVIVVLGYAGVAVSAPSSGLGLAPGRLLEASALLWPFTLAFGGLGVALASRWPRAAVSALAAFAVAEYFLGDLAPLFKAPGWIANLSVFHLYGNPVVQGGSWGPALWMFLVFVAGFGAALILMRRRDVHGA